MPKGGSKPGERRGGRQKGTPNKKSTDIKRIIEGLGCDPIEGMARIAREAEAAKDHPVALAAYKELAQYMYPKRKAIEITGEDGGAIQVQPIGISGVDE